MTYESTIDFNKFLAEEQFFDYSNMQSFPIIKSQNRQMSNEQNLEVMNTSDYLVAFSTQSQAYCVGCVDIVNSTKISASIPFRKLSGYYEVFLNSMSKIIGKFRGKVLKNIGDCLLFYFPYSINSLNESYVDCINCGLAMIQAQKTICEKLITRQLPYLSYRVSADYGNVVIMNTSDSASIDMIGSPVNMCTKINHCANSDEFVIGGDLYEVVKKLNCHSYCEVKSCGIGFKQSYPVYKVY